MSDYLVLKKIANAEPAPAANWTPVAIAYGVENEEAAVVQGYTGEGRYKAIEWPEPEGSEFDLGQGPPAATPASTEGEG